VVPALTLIFGVPTPTAIGTSNVAVVATSTAGASTYIRNRLTNIRLGLLLLTSTTFAALISSLLVSVLPAQVLSGLFALVLAYVAYTMLVGGRRQTANSESSPQSSDLPSEAQDPQFSVPTSPSFASSGPAPQSSDSLGISAIYYDQATDKTEQYTPRRVGAGIGTSALAGVIAGLLGVGGGIVQMPVMNLLMGVPLKVAAGTSNFMIGVTATSAAFVRYAHGDVDPLLAVPTALCVFLGARIGAWLVPRMPGDRLRTIFGWVAVVIAVLMTLQALGIYSARGR
jgi:uncharacterized membrane protein YfcA